MKKEVIIKDILRILIIIFIATTILCIFFGESHAKVGIETNEYKPKFSDESTGTSYIKTMANTVIGTIQIIASIASVLVLGILGIKYMMGSVDEKAEYKNTLKPYVIGVVIVFGITSILNVIIKISTSILPT